MNSPAPTRSALVYGAAANAASRFTLFAATVRYTRLYHRPARRRIADTINQALTEFTERPEGMLFISKELFRQRYIEPTMAALAASSTYEAKVQAEWEAAGLNGGSTCL